MEYGFFIGSMFIFGYAFNFLNWDDIYNLYEKSVRLGVNMYYLNKNEKEINRIESEVILKVDNYFKDVLFKINWKLIETVTVIRECYYKKVKPRFHELTDNYFRIPIKVIKNGEEILSFRNNNDLLKYSNNNDSINYDFILYTKFHHNDSKKNFTIVSDNILEDYKNCTEGSDVGFIIFELCFKDDEGMHKYDINLKEPKNYLLKDNILKSNFFKYYMKTIYNIDLQDNFSINYMTNDMSTSKLNSNFFIKFNEIGLTSFPMKKENVKEEEEEEVDYKNDLISSIINQEKLKRQ